MATKNQKSKVKSQKWMKIVKWVLGVVLVLALILVIGFKIWVSTWQSYRNDEFGFSFKYPKEWYIGGTDVTKKQFNEKNNVFFWVDKEKPEIVQGTTELKRSNGDVVIYFSKNSIGTSDFFDRLSKSELVKVSKFGNKVGYVDEGINGRTSSGDWMAAEYVSIDLSSYSFGADTLTYTKNNPISIMIGLVEHRIGLRIIDSFKFD